MEGKQNPLFLKADLLAKNIYKVSALFPKNEQYGLTSQLRRAGLSVILNIVEGFARQSKKEFRRFLIMSFGSLKETKYLLYFAKEQKYLIDKTHDEVFSLSEEVARLLWATIKKLDC